MQAFVDRFRYKATKARQAQSRLKAIEKLATLPAVTQAPDVVLNFPATKVPAPPLITLDRVKAGYGDHVVLDRLDLRIDPDDRIALLGTNGNGKSTFAKLLAGTLAPMGGEVFCAPKLRVGYFAQHQIEELVPEDSAVQHLARRLPDEREERLRTRLGGFGLSQDKADLPAARLSGGEKARLTFALMSALAPQILILDEPTNHLDIDSREALVEAINDFAGAVILISHDRHLIELTADRLWLVADGRVRPFEGDVESYRQGLLGRARGNGADDGRRSERQRGAEQRQRLAPLRQAAKQAERELERLSRDRSALAARLASAATYRLPGAEVEALARRDAELEAAIAVAETRWLEAEQELEQAQA
jgi:ATP-binding cassette subfamily F protein 3